MTNLMKFGDLKYAYSNSHSCHLCVYKIPYILGFYKWTNMLKPPKFISFIIVVWTKM